MALPFSFRRVLLYGFLVSLKLRIMNKQTELIRDKALDILKQAATALAFMNAKGWVHRDIKPDNILVNSAGEVRIIDFAIADTYLKPYSVLTESTFNAMFPSHSATYSYAGLVNAASTYPAFGGTGDLAAQKREVAAFLANVAHETGSLQYVEEIVKGDYCQPSAGCPCERMRYEGGSS